MTITHTFKSGNSCELHVLEVVKPGKLNIHRCDWEHHPPSTMDLKELNEQVYPQKVFPVLEPILRKTQGPGSLKEFLPGVWEWVSETESSPPQGLDWHELELGARADHQPIDWSDLLRRTVEPDDAGGGEN
jgi:hypothetical protein